MRLFQLPLVLAVISAAFGAPHASVQTTHSRLFFEPNMGQTAPLVRYFARTKSGTVFFTERAVVLSASGGTVTLELAGMVQDAPWTPAEKAEETTSYYVGRDSKRWAKDVPHYGRITRRAVYPRIDLTYYGTEDRLEYDFLLAPQADPNDIRLRVTGTDSISLAPDGALLLTSPTGTVRQEKPVVWQTLKGGSTRRIDGAFRLFANNEVGFEVGPYDRNLPLSIDPVLSYSSYFGGSDEDRVVFATGSTLAVGSTRSIDIPGASFARRSGMDFFFRSGNTTVVLGGTGDDQVTAASVSGNFLIIGGYTNSTDLPTGQLFLTNSFSFRQPAAYWQKDYAGGATDGFLTAFDLTGQSQNVGLFTYFGTSGDDVVTGVSYATNGFAAVGYTNGSGIPQPQFPSYQPAQASPAGGIDGFLVAGTLSFGGGATLLTSTYLGGSGDDMPRSVFLYNSTGSTYYVTGTTTSSDFPVVNPLQSTRSGASDAFVMEYKPASDGSLAVWASTLFGGNGSDRGDSIALLPNLNVVVGGTTSSTDLPRVQAWQGSYSGGDTDAFLAQFAPDLSSLVRSTYSGGSGHEETTAVATDFNSNIVWAGWTSSSDFPQIHPVQPQFGGGPDDGFLVQFGSDNSVGMASTFGGSGSDRILGMTLSSGTVWIVGQTTSADLPLQKADQPSLKGASDGFIASIVLDFATIVHSISVGKGGRTSISGAINATGSSLTVTSSDPSKVLVAANTDDPGQSSVVFPATPPFIGFFVDCLDDHGGATLTLTSDGGSSQTSMVTCFPLRLVAPTTLQAVAWTTSNFFGPVNLVAGNPANGSLFYQDLQPGADPIIVQIASSNPASGTVLNAVKLSHGNAYGLITFSAQAPGQTDLIFTADALGPGATATTHVTVSSPLRVASSLAIPQGFQLRVFSPSIILPGPSPSTLTITSGDSSRVVLSADPNQAGTPTLSLAANLSSSFYVQALDNSGDVPLTWSLPGLDNVTTTVHLSTPVAAVSGSSIVGPPVVVGIGQKTSFSPIIGAAGLNFFSSAYSLNPGTPPQTYSLTAADPTMVTVSPASISFPVSPSVAFQVTGIAVGTTQLTLHPPDGIAAAPFSPTVKVDSRPAALSTTEVGKDLQAPMTLTLPVPFAGATAVKITSANPAAALLSLDTTSPGQAQINTSFAPGSTAVSFQVYGLASKGQVTITAEIQGAPPITGTVTLDASGFGWSADTLSTALYVNPSSIPSVGPFALDAASLLPVATQRLRQGVSVVVPVTNQNPDIVSINAQSFAFPGTAAWSLTPLSAGKATLSLVQPAGFTAPSIRTQLAITITTPVLSVSSFTLGQNTQSVLQIYNIPAADLPLTVSSSNPSKLVFSSDPTVLGSASVTVRGAARQQIFAQGLDSTGVVTITASMPTFADTTTTVQMASAGFGIYIDPGNSAVVMNGIAQTTTRSPKTKLNLQLMTSYGGNISGNAQLRPGLGPVSVDVSSSNSVAGSIEGSPARYGNTPSVNFVPADVGDTDVSVVQPAGFVAFPSLYTKQSFHVTTPSLTANDLTMGKDTFATTALGLLQNVNPPDKNVTVTVTSSDPSSVLLSLDPATAPTASITGTLVAGSRSIYPVYVHALQNSGTVPVAITAPGYQDGSFKVTLTDTVFVFGTNRFSTGASSIPLQAGPQKITVLATLASSGSNPNQLTLRPGAPDIVLNIATSDPNIVAIDTPQVVFKAGSNSASGTYHPVATGSATLSLSVPSGYVTDPVASQFPINVQGSRLSFSGGGMTLGKDLQGSVGFSAETPFIQPTPITVTSSDPSRLLIAADEKTPGQASVVITPGLNQAGGGVYFQALGSDGTVSVAISSDGYQSASFPVTLAPSAAIFGVTSPQNILTTGSPQTVSVNLTTLDPVTLAAPCCFSSYQPRAGASLSATITSSDPTILASDTSSITFPSPNGGASIKVRPVSAGTAILTLSPLPGGVTASTGATVVYNVSEPPFSVPGIYVGRDLQVPAQIRLGSSLPTPASDLSVNIVTNDTFYMQFGSSLAAASVSSLNVIVPAGQRISVPFYVRGLQVGIASLGIYAGSNNSFPTLTVSQTSFIFREAASGPIHATAGVSTSLTIVPSLPSAPVPSAPLQIRPGTSVTVNVTSSDPSIVSVGTPLVALGPGDTLGLVALRPLRAGRATIRVSGTGYDFSSTQAAVDVIVQ